MKSNRLLPLFLILPLLTGCESGVLSRVPGLSGPDRLLPQEGEVPGLHLVSKKHVFQGEEMAKHLGTSAAIYINYGATVMSTADYTLGGPGRNLTVEAFVMNQDVAAAGLFHYYRGKKLKNAGRPIAVGAEGVIDTPRENRNLYFYKRLYFLKLIYTGPEPVPDLVPLAEQLAVAMGGESARPRGFEFLEVPGVNPASARVTPGYTFNCDFLPPGVFAEASGAGPIAEVFLIAHNDEKTAAKTAQDHRTYLELNQQEYGMKYGPRRRRIWWARDRDQGRMIVTQYGDWLIGVLRPKNYDLGEALLDQVVGKIAAGRRR